MDLEKKENKKEHNIAYLFVWLGILAVLFSFGLVVVKYAPNTDFFMTILP